MCATSQQPERVFAEIYRVLKPGGCCIVTCSNRLYYSKVGLARLHASDCMKLLCAFALSRACALTQTGMQSQLPLRRPSRPGATGLDTAACSLSSSTFSASVVRLWPEVRAVWSYSS